MSFNEQVARAIVRGFNKERQELVRIDAVKGFDALVPPTDPDEFDNWLDSDTNDGPLVIMGITPLRTKFPDFGQPHEKQVPGSWDPHRAFYLLMRGIGFSVTEDKTDAIIGALYECWQGYTWLSYDANKLDMCFPPPKPVEPAPERLCGAIPISGNMKGQLSCTVPASQPHTDHRHGLWTWQ